MNKKNYRLIEIFENYDYLRKPLSELERMNFQGDYPYYGAQGIIDYVQEYRCDGEYLLIAEDGENLKSRKQPIALIADGKFWVNNHAHIVKTNDLADIKFMCYLLNHSDINGYVTGSAQPKLSQGNLNRIKTTIPDIDYQKKIVNILYPYDELIELNNKRIQLFERIIEEIYKEWFVRLRFPGYMKYKFIEKRPCGWICGNKANMKIPVNWHFGKLNEIGQFIRGKSITSIEMKEGEIPVVSAGIEPSGYHNESNAKGKSLTISASGANAGFLRYNLEDIWAADCSYYQNTENIWFVYSSLKFIEPAIKNLQVGSAQPHVYAKNINKLNIIIPEVKYIKMYNDLVNPMFEEIKKTSEKNKILTKQRDLLLPRLMSGKLEIK